MSSEFLEQTKRSLSSQDKPLGKQVPGAPFAIVALTYLAVLALAVSGIATVAWMFD